MAYKPNSTRKLRLVSHNFLQDGLIEVDLENVRNSGPWKTISECVSVSVCVCVCEGNLLPLCVAVEQPH